MKQLKEFIMLSAELSNLSFNENRDRSVKLYNMLNDLDLDFKTVNGVYKGVREISFMVVVKNEAEIQTVKDLGLKTFNQESVLFRDLHGKASLFYNNGTSEVVGSFKQVDDVEDVENYSIVDGKYWICG